MSVEMILGLWRHFTGLPLFNVLRQYVTEVLQVLKSIFDLNQVCIRFSRICVVLRIYTTESMSKIMMQEPTYMDILKNSSEDT
jgi:hypothetical protein